MEDMTRPLNKIADYNNRLQVLLLHLKKFPDSVLSSPHMLYWLSYYGLNRSLKAMWKGIILESVLMLVSNSNYGFMKG